MTQRPSFTIASLLCLCRCISLAQSRDDLNDLSLEQLLKVKVTSASLHEQSLKDAPASVTVITAAEIRKFGYRTLAEALAYVRGFYVSTDHTVSTVGLRGFALPDDFDTRLIVMIDGHSIADNVFAESIWFENDFPVDIDLVDRIEILHGPSSALYGSAGILATINVVTRRPTGPATTSVRFETGSLGERKTEVSTSADLGKGASLLFAVAAFNDAGAQQLYFPQLDAPETNFGRAVDMDGRKGYHAFADLTWGNWEILAVTGDRVQIQPVSWGPTIFNDRGTRAEDSRGFLDISYTREFSGDRSLTWRTSYDEYRFRGIYRYASDEGVVDNRERDYGDWLGSKLSYRLPDGFGGHLTVGAEARFDLRALQNVFDVNPDQAQILWIDQPDRFAGFFAQQEWTWGTHWEVNVGGRFDWSRLRPNSFSPRAALIYKPSSRTDVKFLYGRGFRNPSNFEMFFANGFGQLANPSLRAETSNTYEVDVEHEIGKRFRAGASVYRYAVDNLIEQTYDNSGNAQFRNVDRVHAEGVSAELDVLLPAGVEIRSSLEVQHAVYNSGATLSNSPRQVGKLQLSFPFWRDRLEFGAGVQGLGERLDYDGIPIGWAIVPEAVIGTRRLPGGFQFTAGVKNLSNSFYRIPAGLGNDVDSIAAAGRTFYFTAGWTSSETRTDTAKGAPRERIR